MSQSPKFLTIMNAPRTRRVLEIVHEHGPATRPQIEEVYGCSNGGCAQVLSALAEAGYLDYYPGDGRSLWVYEAKRPVTDLDTVSQDAMNRCKYGGKRQSILFASRKGPRVRSLRHDEMRAKLEADVDRFLAQGGEIEPLPCAFDQAVPGSQAHAVRGLGGVVLNRSQGEL